MWQSSPNKSHSVTVNQTCELSAKNAVVLNEYIKLYINTYEY